MWSSRNPLLHCCHFSRIQFQEAISRASDNFVVASHAELSGLRQGWRIVTVRRQRGSVSTRGSCVLPHRSESHFGEDTQPTQQTWQSTRRFQKHAGGLGSHNPPRAPAILQQQLTLLHKALSGASMVLSRIAVRHSWLLLVVPTRRFHGRSSAILARRQRSLASDWLL